MSSSTNPPRWTGDALWALALPLAALLFILSMRVFAPASAAASAAPGTPPRHETGFAIAVIAACLIVLTLCWRGFEFLLWLRFPTANQHTVAARIAAAIAIVGLLVQVPVMLLVK
ncbi:MAG: hypothetical protein ACOVP8_08010 [Phycisphaerales bacterium]|jgi:hypothetical protein